MYAPVDGYVDSPPVENEFRDTLSPAIVVSTVIKSHTHAPFVGAVMQKYW